jgi:pimeloyl-ACP methyl ester carboxylesterase
VESLELGSDRSTLRYHDIPGAGPPLIFIHGLGCASSCDYPRIASDPALFGRRMLLVDLLGSGFSDHPADFGYTVDDHARTVLELARSLSLDALDLFGHSLGGSIAIAAAGLLEGRVRHLVLGEPNFRPGGGVFSRGIAAVTEDDYVAHGHDDLVRSSRAEGLGIWAASLSISSPRGVHRAATSLVVGCNPTWGAQLLALTMSRTVIFGEASLPDPDAERLRHQGVLVEIVPDAGHLMAWDNPAGVALALRRALALTSSGGNLLTH